MSGVPSREVPLVPAHGTLLLIDVQNFCSDQAGGEFKGPSTAELDGRFGYLSKPLGDQVGRPPR